MKSFGLKELAEHYFATESEATDYVSASDYEKLLAERDALSAQVNTLRDAINYSGTYKTCQEIFNALVMTPQQCLAEIKAEAGRAGFLEGVRQMCDNEIGRLGHDAESCANHYAARVRLCFEPGTWLKDSNVNGGRRQGGDK